MDYNEKKKTSKKPSYCFNLQVLSLQDLNVPKHVLQDNKANTIPPPRRQILFHLNTHTPA